jgi:hypothetical protein
VVFGEESQKNPDNRALVRSYLRPRAVGFLEAINEVVRKVPPTLKSQGYSALVVVVDNLERVDRSELSGGQRTSHDALFIESSQYLRGIDCHVVYTVPAALLTSLNGARLDRLYGRLPEFMPMVPTASRGGAPNFAGLSRLKEAVLRRLEQAGLRRGECEPVISPDDLERLCAASGGDIRNLMILMQRAIASAPAFPISSDAVLQVIKAVRDDKIRAVTEPQHWEILREVGRMKSPTGSEAFLQLLDKGLVFAYRDGDGPWYDVNPLLREALQYKG